MTKVDLLAYTGLSSWAYSGDTGVGYTAHGFIGEDWEPVNYESDADELAEMAGRLCYLSFDRPNPATASNKDYLANIIRQGHESVLSHASATFYVETTRACSHEMIRHRWLSFSEVSQRYVSPNKIMEHTGVANDSFSPAVDEYNRVYSDLRESGHGVKAARGKAREALPLGFPTAMIVSGNMRAWRDFLRQRLSPAADAEIRAVAEDIRDILADIAPNSFQDLA